MVFAGVVMWVSDWVLQTRESVDPYVREVSRKIERARNEAIRERMK